MGTFSLPVSLLAAVTILSVDGRVVLVVSLLSLSWDEADCWSSWKSSKSSKSSSDNSAIACVRSEAKTAVLGGDSSVCCQFSHGEPGGEMRKFFLFSGTRSCDNAGSTLIGLCYSSHGKQTAIRDIKFDTYLSVINAYLHIIKSWNINAFTSIFDIQVNWLWCGRWLCP